MAKKDPASKACERLFGRVAEGTATTEELAIFPQLVAPYWNQNVQIEDEKQDNVVPMPPPQTTPFPESGPVSMKQICEYSGYSEDKIRQWIREGIFPQPIEKRPRHVRYDAAQVREFFKELRGQKAS